MKTILKTYLCLLAVTVTSTTCMADKLKDLFDRAQPMHFEQFLQINDPSIKSWNCAGGYHGDTSARVLGYVPVRAKAKVMVTPAQAPAGPAFPGTPEQDKMIDAIVWTGVGSQDTGEINLTGLNYKLNTSNGVSDQQSGNSYNFVGLNLMYIGGGIVPVTVTETFKTVDNMIVVKTDTDNAGIITDYPYIYCYEKN